MLTRLALLEPTCKHFGTGFHPGDSRVMTFVAAGEGGVFLLNVVNFGDVGDSRLSLTRAPHTFASMSTHLPVCRRYGMQALQHGR